MNNIAVIILAAGKGSRMKSDLPKVLHKVAGKSMVNHVIEAALAVASCHIHVVVGHQAQEVKDEVQKYHKVHFAFQKELIGTGDAVRVGLSGLDACIQHVLVLCGDVPLIQEKTLNILIHEHLESQACLSVLSVSMDNPKGYGRIVQNNKNSFLCIREEADASEAEKKITNVNSGVYCFDKDFLVSGIKRIHPKNNQAEYYLTDLVEIAQELGKKVNIVTIDDPKQVIGVNTVEELAQAESLILDIKLDSKTKLN